MIIDHICFAVKDIHESIKQWCNAFEYVQMTEIVINSKQKVKVVFLQKENSISIKLIEPLEENQSVSAFVKRGGGFHHLCFKCDDLDSGIKELNSKGLMTIVPPQTGEAFDNEEIAFLLSRFGVNVELIDTDKKAKIIKS